MRQIATELGDTSLLANISVGDLIAIGGKYHLRCLVDLRNRHRAFTRKYNQKSTTNEERFNESRACHELTTLHQREC